LETSKAKRLLCQDIIKGGVKDHMHEYDEVYQMHKGNKQNKKQNFYTNFNSLKNAITFNQGKAKDDLVAYY
jgi:hypothetical protein